MTSAITVQAVRPTTTDPRLYYPAEGFGNLYRRMMLNDFFAGFLRRANIRTVAELPLDSYGIIGAGSLIFRQLGCDLTLVGDDQRTLDRAKALMRFNQLDGVRYLHSPLTHIPVEDNAFDFTWSFDRLQVLPNPPLFLQELCRVSKATMVIVPNGYNYGQFAHHLYHWIDGQPCDYVGPRHWLRLEPIKAALASEGMTILATGMIDVPWWPEFPELPNLVRRILRRPPVGVDEAGIPEQHPETVAESDLPDLRRRVVHSALIERARYLPRFVRLLFAHNVYVIGCKPPFRHKLGLSDHAVR